MQLVELFLAVAAEAFFLPPVSLLGFLFQSSLTQNTIKLRKIVKNEYKRVLSIFFLVDSRKKLRNEYKIQLLSNAVLLAKNDTDSI